MNNFNTNFLFCIILIVLFLDNIMCILIAANMLFWNTMVILCFAFNMAML